MLVDKGFAPPRDRILPCHFKFSGERFCVQKVLVSNCAGLLPAWIKASSRARSSALSFTTYFLTAISFPATNHLHRLILATEIQKNATDSMTLATSKGCCASPTPSMISRRRREDVRVQGSFNTRSCPLGDNRLGSEQFQSASR